MKKATQYLLDNPRVDVIHSTSDGYLFFVKNDAVNHAKTLEDNTVITLHKSDVDAQRNSTATNLKMVSDYANTQKEADNAETEKAAQVVYAAEAEKDTPVVKLAVAEKALNTVEEKKSKGKT